MRLANQLVVYLKAQMSADKSFCPLMRSRARARVGSALTLWPFDDIN